MRSSFAAFCSRFAMRSAGSIFVQIKRCASHRDAATALKEKLSFNLVRIAKNSAVL